MIIDFSKKYEYKEVKSIFEKCPLCNFQTSEMGSNGFSWFDCDKCYFTVSYGKTTKDIYYEQNINKYYIMTIPNNGVNLYRCDNDMFVYHIIDNPIDFDLLKLKIEKIRLMA